MTTLPDTQALVLEPQGSVLTIWLNRPEARNALSAEMVDELGAVLDATRDDRSLRTIILRGKGGFFCAGGDIKGFKSDLQGGAPDRDEVARGNRSFGDLMIKLNEQPQTVIILVEGAAIGGGLGLACVGDITIVTRDARFRLSETSLGIPPAQIAPFVTERVGLTQARRLMLTGARFQGEEAVHYGIGHILARGRRRPGSQMRRRCWSRLPCARPAPTRLPKALFSRPPGGHGPRRWILPPADSPTACSAKRAARVLRPSWKSASPGGQTD